MLLDQYAILSANQFLHRSTAKMPQHSGAPSIDYYGSVAQLNAKADGALIKGGA